MMHMYFLSFFLSFDYSYVSNVQGMTWLLPERFSNSEIGPEAGFLKLW